MKSCPPPVTAWRRAGTHLVAEQTCALPECPVHLDGKEFLTAENFYVPLANDNARAGLRRGPVPLYAAQS